MLNKLLKRCMPWMDKGRWYHIRVDDDNVTYDNIFSRHEVGNDYIDFYFKPGFQGNIIDINATYDRYVGIDVNDTVAGSSGIARLSVGETGPYIRCNRYSNKELFDVWLFIRPIETVVEGE